MPFIGEDWRGPGEDWVKSEDGWEIRKVGAVCRQTIVQSINL